VNRLFLLFIPVMLIGCLGTNRYVGYPRRCCPPNDTQSAIISSSVTTLPFFPDDYDDVF
jgi:hypothetical protein